MTSPSDDDRKVLKSADIEEFKRRVGAGEYESIVAELAKPFSKMAQFVKSKKG
jgi:hypothetical protein